MNASTAYLNGAGSQRHSAGDITREIELLNTLLTSAGSERPVRDTREGGKERHKSGEQKSGETDFHTPGGFNNDPQDPNNPNEERERHLRRINR